jgi:hypothetical protein
MVGGWGDAGGVIAAHRDLSREVVTRAPGSAAENGDGTPCAVRFVGSDG